MQYSFVTHARHNVVKNNLSINVVKILSKWSTAVSLKKPPKSVSDTGNPYHVACLQYDWTTPFIGGVFALINSHRVYIFLGTSNEEL